jgi:RNAse (barnase) inhibitor barstar
MNNNFIFTDDVAGYSAGTVLVNVPKAINSKADLLALLARDLSFPDAFGANWDALFDCLCDLC